MGAFFDLSYTVFKEIWVPPKIRVLPSGTLSQILDLDNFPHSKLILLSTKLVSGRACSTTTVDTPWLVTTHWSAITALLLFVMLVGRQEGHPACKNTVLGCWCGCLSGASADLHIAQLMPLPLTFSCFRLVLPFWYRLTWVVPEKGLLNGCVCVCCCCCTTCSYSCAAVDRISTDTGCHAVLLQLQSFLFQCFDTAPT